jgi:hypothetical protein
MVHARIPWVRKPFKFSEKTLILSRAKIKWPVEALVGSDALMKATETLAFSLAQYETVDHTIGLL